MAAKTSSPGAAFAKVLRSFETGGFTCLDVVAELKRLLKAGASPTEMSEILRRREFVEPLPLNAHKEVLGLLDAAKERAAAEASDQQVESAGVGAIAPTIAPSAASAEGAPKTSIRIVPPPVVEGSGDVVVRAITLARTSASRARTSALPGSARHKTGRTAPGRTGVAAPTPSTAPIPTLIPPAEKLVSDHKPAQAELQKLDDRSDLALADGNGPKGRVIGSIAAVLGLAAIAWLYARYEPMPTKAAVPAAAAPIPGTLIRDCPTCAAMIVLPAARFKQGFAAADRGSVSYEKPQHWVDIIRPFAMSTDLVTVEEYRQFIDATGRATQGCDTYDGSWNYRPENNWQEPGFAQSALHPVTCVSWNDAVAYAQWYSAKTGHQYRLPSASEWEYAARAGGETVYPWASNGADACAYANVADASAARQYPGWVAFACDDGYAGTSPVGSFKANSFGLNDMLGNVFQWTLDCWHADYRGAPVDGSARTDGDCSERELRGGSWFTSPSYVRANYRNHFASDYRTSSVGIRLIREIGP